MKIIAEIDFFTDLKDIKKFLESNRKEYFHPNDRILFVQKSEDTYPFFDGAGKQLTEIQKLVSQIDISNCFILIQTSNKNIKQELEHVAKYYSTDSIIFDFQILPGNYQRVNQKQHNSACQKLWNHLYVGPDLHIKPCCVSDAKFPLGSLQENSVEEVISGESAELIRWAMTQGYRTESCRFCYEREDQGLPSHRNAFIPNDNTVINIDYLDIRSSNICNFKCRMCNSYFSSAIEKEEQLIYGKKFKEKNRIQSLEVFEILLSYVNNQTKKIYFAGGEPLLMDEHYAILEKLIAINNTDLELTYNTNCSVLTYKNYNVLDLWTRFTNVKVGASIDASDQVAEYLRHGTIWENIKYNIDQIKKQTPHVRLHITSTVGFLNVENLIKLQSAWIDDAYFSVDQLEVSIMNGDLLSVASVPTKYKSKISKMILNHINNLGKCLLANQWKNVLEYMENNDLSYHHDDFKNKTNTLDRHRGDSFVTVFPQYKDLVE